MARIPLYYNVYKKLKNQLKDGKIKVGEMMPAEPRLQEEFEVSRITIRKAIEMLVEEGYLKVKQGKGTVVLTNKTSQKLNKITSLTETLEEKGYNVTSLNINIDKVSNVEHIAKEFGIDSESELIRLVRIRVVDDKPIAISITYLLPEMVKGIENKISKINSLYKLLESEYSIIPENAIETISAKRAGFTEAEMLMVEVGEALITSKRITSVKDKVFEVVFTSIVADKYEYKVYLKGR